MVTLTGERLAQRLVIALLFANLLVRVWQIAGDWNFGDVNAYWLAAERLRNGEPLYLPGLDPDSYRVFRYAPWFAWLWVPLTYLPRTLVEWGWAAILALSSAALLAGLLRRRSVAALALAMLMAPWLLSLVQVGNVQPLVVAAVGFGMSRATGPLWVGLSASLKVVPGIFVLVYAARREWGRVVLALAITAVLAAPYLLYNLDGYQTAPGRSFSFYYYVGPWAWVLTATAATVAAVFLAIRRSPYVWVATALAVMLVAPRTHVTYATYLLVGVIGGTADRIGAGRG